MSTTSADHRSETPPYRPSIGSMSLVVIAVGILGAAFFVAVPVWIVNFDGTSYLALAANLRQMEGFVAPDGSVMTVRGPGYPLLLALGWLFDGYPSGLAMAASRAALITGGALAGLVALRISRSAVAGIAAGALVLASPILLQAGGIQLFPDGLAAVFVLASVLLIVDRDTSWHAVVAAGIMAGAAFVTKESHSLVLVGVIVWAAGSVGGLRRLLSWFGWFVTGAAVIVVPWLVFGLATDGALPGALPGVGGFLGWGVAAALPVVAGASLLVRNRVPDRSITIAGWVAPVAAFVLVVLVSARGAADIDRWVEMPRRLADVLTIDAYLDGWIVAAALLVGLALLGAVTAWHRLGPLPAVAAGAFGLLVFSAYAGTVARNAVLLPMVLAIVGACALAGLDAPRWRTVLSWVVGIAALVAGVGASLALADSLDAERLTAEAQPTVFAAEWLDDNAPEVAVAGTPTAFQSVWRLGPQPRSTALVPMYITSSDRFAEGAAFSTAYGWLGKPPAPPRSGPALAYSIIGGDVSAVFAEDVEATLADFDLIVLTGNTRYPASPADGGVVALLLDMVAHVEPVFVDHFMDAQWVAIVRPVSADVDDDGPPLVRYVGDRPVSPPGDGGLDLGAYAEAVRALLDRWANDLS